jgi:hypothetical protein
MAHGVNGWGQFFNIYKKKMTRELARLLLLKTAVVGAGLRQFLSGHSTKQTWPVLH